MYHTTNNQLTQGNQRNTRGDKELPMLKVVLTKKKIQKSNTLDVHSYIKEIPCTKTNAEQEESLGPISSNTDITLEKTFGYPK